MISGRSRSSQHCQGKKRAAPPGRSSGPLKAGLVNNDTLRSDTRALPFARLDLWTPRDGRGHPSPGCPPRRVPRARDHARCEPGRARARCDPAVGCSRDASRALRVSRCRGRARARGRVAHHPGRQVRARLAAERGLARVAAPHSGRARPRRPGGGLGRARGAGRAPVLLSEALGPKQTVQERFADEQRRGRVRRGDQRRAGAPSRLPERPRDARDASEDQAQPPRRAPRGAGGGDRAGAQDEPARARRSLLGGASVFRVARGEDSGKGPGRRPGGGDGGPVRL